MEMQAMKLKDRIKNSIAMLFGKDEEICDIAYNILHEGEPCLSKDVDMGKFNPSCAMLFSLPRSSMVALGKADILSVLGCDTNGKPLISKEASDKLSKDLDILFKEY